MRLKYLALLLSFMGLSPALSSANCFVAKEKGKIIKQEGACAQRHSPFSTFKIPLAIMGFDSGVLTSSTEPVIDFTDTIKTRMGRMTNLPSRLFWYRAQTPATWMKYSVLWYSQEITKNLGFKKFKDYVRRLNYGNANVSGTPHKNDGLLKAWIQSSLKISALEQVILMEKLSQKELSISKDAQEKTINLISLDAFIEGWKLYGRTGGGMVWAGLLAGLKKAIDVLFLPSTSSKKRFVSVVGWWQRR